MSRRKVTPEQLTALAMRFRALSEVSRLQIVHALHEGPRTVTELVSITGLSQPNVSRHLQVLTLAGLIERTRKGTTIECRIIDKTLFKVCDLLCRG